MRAPFMTIWPGSMSKLFFEKLENLDTGYTRNLKEVLSQLNYNAQGLVPAIAQQYDTGEVLMQAWMNAEAISRTLDSGKVCYWSRSRKKFWTKGEESGHTQTLKALQIDCDGDSLLLQVDQNGPACHTNRPSCFYLMVKEDKVVISSDN